MMEAPRASETVLILGARSDIAIAIARSFAQSGADLILAARSASRLDADAQDLKDPPLRRRLNRRIRCSSYSTSCILSR